MSQQAHLYAYHLSRCPSYSAAHRAVPIPQDDDNLPELRRSFAREIKRNLFEAYLRPRETIISLVSTSISSSSAPGGEAFHFSLSPRGHYILAYSSSRIHIIDVTGNEVVVKRELKILRRPASATITDDGSLLAVLSTDLQIDLYNLTEDIPKHTRAITLDHNPRTIALSPTGSVLAAAYDSGVEVSSLDINHQNVDRRAVKCYAVDALAFSKDGTQLLGSTVHSRSPSTVILTAPYYDPGANSPEESVSALWTTSILFPNGSRDCSHAVLLPSSSNEESVWTFTYDRVFETFRAVRIDDLRNGTTYFTGPASDSAAKLLPSTLPAASQAGDLVASGFQGSIWLYGVPEDLEALPSNNPSNSNNESGVSTPASQLGRRNSAPSLRSTHRHRDSIRTPQWQLLCDRLRHTFVEGRKVSTLDRVSAMAWVSDRPTFSSPERLVAVAPGVLSSSSFSEDDGMSPVDGGRISIIDFDYSITNGETRMITIEVGANEPQVLEEEHRDLDAEVAIVRRRTVAQRRGTRNHVSRSATTLPRAARQDLTPMPNTQDGVDRFSPSARPVRRPSTQTTSTETSETASIDEMEAFDDPYSHTSPRSGTTLRRAATAAAVNRRFRPIAPDHIEYRRADGREEHPHESDADNWVPPPPPYSREPLPPLPEHIQRSILAEAAASGVHRSATHRSPILDSPGLDSSSLHRSRTVASTSSSGSRRDRFTYQRTFSDPSTMTDRLSFEEDAPRPMTSSGMPASEENADLYDVSPQGTPPLRPRQLSDPVPQSAISPQEEVPSPGRATANQIPRRPVAVSNISDDSESPSPKPIMSATLHKPASPIPELRSVSNESNTEERVDAPTPPNWPLVMNTRVESQSRDVEVVRYVESPVEIRNSSWQSNQPRVHEDSDFNNAHDQSADESQSPYPLRSETAPVTGSPSYNVEEDPLPMWQRTGTAPAAPVCTSLPGVGMPTSDQMARLNSRRGRPSGVVDPSRRMSGSSQHRPNHSGGSDNDFFSRGPLRNTPPRLTPEQSFNAAQTRQSHISNVSYSGHLPRPNAGHPRSENTYSSSPSRRISSAPNPQNRQQSHSPSNIGIRRQSSTAPPSNLRPSMARLETIHSIASQQPEPSPYYAQKQVMMSRQASRAERSAHKNINDAKKRGWRASMRKEEKKNKKYAGDSASSAGWTDVSVDGGKEKKGGKCVVM